VHYVPVLYVHASFTGGLGGVLQRGLQSDWWGHQSVSTYLGRELARDIRRVFLLLDSAHWVLVCEATAQASRCKEGHELGDR